MTTDPDVSRTTIPIYDRLCESYHAVDDFRMKLLGLLPVATGTGVFLLLSGNAELLTAGAAASETAKGQVPQALAAIGAFGFLFTLGLFSYELFGIKRCHYLIQSGKRLEASLHVRGQFRNRPHAIAGLVNEPFASSVIYPASIAAWLFLGSIFRLGAARAGLLAGSVAVLGCVGTLAGARLIELNQEHEDQVVEAIRRHGPMSMSQLEQELRLIPRLGRLVHRLQKRGDVVAIEGKLTTPLDDNSCSSLLRKSGSSLRSGDRGLVEPPPRAPEAP